MLSFEDGKDSKENQDEHDDAESSAESKHMIMNDIYIYIYNDIYTC